MNLKMVFAAVVAVMMFVTASYAQDVKTVNWSDFVSGIDFVETGNRWDFVHAGRPLVEYTVVNFPAGAFSLKTFFKITTEKEAAVYLATLNTGTFQVEGRSASVRVMFSCTLANDAECRSKLSTHLTSGVSAQSLGVPDGYSDGALPDRIILSFLINTAGHFD